jgi:hypothetical protein
MQTSTTCNVGSGGTAGSGGGNSVSTAPNGLGGQTGGTLTLN